MSPAEVPVAPPPPRAVGPSLGQRIRDYLELTKARLSSLVLVTVAVGYLLAPPGGEGSARFLAACLGAMLGAFGACALNQWWERGWDARMERTRARPIPSGRIAPGEALAISLLLLASGAALLAVRCGPVPALITLGIAVVYVLAYTPLKRRTPWSLVPGALSGAAPPLVGWAAAGDGSLPGGAWSLFGIVLAWQVPHVLAIDWVHREDAERAGYCTVATRDPSGGATGRLATAGALALLAASAGPLAAGLGGPVYAGCAALLGLALLAFTLDMQRRPSRRTARRLFFATLGYLPLLLAALVAATGQGAPL